MRNSILQLGKFICSPLKWNFPTHTNTIRFAESIHGIITRMLSYLSWRDKEHEPFYQADRVPRWCKASDTCMDIDTS